MLRGVMVFWLIVIVFGLSGCTTLKYEIYQPRWDQACSEDNPKLSAKIWWAFDKVRWAEHNHIILAHQGPADKYTKEIHLQAASGSRFVKALLRDALLGKEVEPDDVTLAIRWMKGVQATHEKSGSTYRDFGRVISVLEMLEKGQI